MRKMTGAEAVQYLTNVNKEYGIHTEETTDVPAVEYSRESIFASSLDPPDLGVRLDWYVYGKDRGKLNIAILKERMRHEKDDLE